jgi:hypothetical protein
MLIALRGVTAGCVLTLPLAFWLHALRPRHDQGASLPPFLAGPSLLVAAALGGLPGLFLPRARWLGLLALLHVGLAIGAFELAYHPYPFLPVTCGHYDQPIHGLLVTFHLLAAALGLCAAAVAAAASRAGSYH